MRCYIEWHPGRAPLVTAWISARFLGNSAEIGLSTELDRTRHIVTGYRDENRDRLSPPFAAFANSLRTSAINPRRGGAKLLSLGVLHKESSTIRRSAPAHFPVLCQDARHLQIDPFNQRVNALRENVFPIYLNPKGIDPTDIVVDDLASHVTRESQGVSVEYAKSPQRYDFIPDRISNDSGPTRMNSALG